MDKLLTVVIPAYNTEQYLRRCLDSLLQTSLRERMELIVVNDGSTDTTGQIAEEYHTKYPEIVVTIHKENGGHGSAINSGIERASGMYFRVLDSDDWVDTEACDAYLGLLDKLDCDLVATPFVTVHKNKKTLRSIEGAREFPKAEVIPFCSVADKLHVRMHEWTIRTAILKEHEIRLKEHSFYVDMQFILFPVPWIRTVCFLDTPVYQYYLGDEGQSVSVKNMQKNRLQHFEIIKSLIAFFDMRQVAGDEKERLYYIAKGIAKMEVNQVQTILSLPIGKKAGKELHDAEEYLKTTCPMAFQMNPGGIGGICVRVLRKSNNRFYPLAAAMWRIN